MMQICEVLFFLSSLGNKQIEILLQFYCFLRTFIYFLGRFQPTLVQFGKKQQNKATTRLGMKPCDFTIFIKFYKAHDSANQSKMGRNCASLASVLLVSVFLPWNKVLALSSHSRLCESKNFGPEQLFPKLPEVGLEPRTFRHEDWCSIHSSTGDFSVSITGFSLLQ